MQWLELFPQSKKPVMDDFKNFIGNKLFDNLIETIETDYKIHAQIEYSKCVAAPGWNIKFKKGAKSLCVIYPHKKYLTALVVIGKKDEARASDLLKDSNPYLKELYNKTNFSCGGRWLMIDVKDKDILKYTIELINIRVLKPKK